MAKGKPTLKSIMADKKEQLRKRAVAAGIITEEQCEREALERCTAFSDRMIARMFSEEAQPR